MPINTEINGDDLRGGSERVRLYLEQCLLEARSLTPLAEFALGGLTQYMYGTARADDIAGEQGLVEYWLRFANGEEDVSTRKYALELHRELPEGLADPEVAARLNAVLAPEEIEARRTQVKERLANICRWYKGGQSIKTGSESSLRGVWALPILRREPLQLVPFWVITSASAFDAFLGVLLLDEKRRFGRDLRHCALEGCPRFFLQPAQAGRPQQYCSEEHAKEAHEGGSARRARNSRLRASATRLLMRQHGRRSAAEIKVLVKHSFKERPSTTPEQLAEHVNSLIKANLVRAQRKHK